jgi:hypothetical protein
VPEPNDAAVISAGRTALACLDRAGLVNTEARSTGVWRGLDRGSGRLVYVDGPYGSPASAQTSAESLTEVSLAVAGGPYVVSAPLRSTLESTVDDVAACLRGAG